MTGQVWGAVVTVGLVVTLAAVTPVCVRFVAELVRAVLEDRRETRQG